MALLPVAAAAKTILPRERKGKIDAALLGDPLEIGIAGLGPCKEFGVLAGEGAAG